MPLLMGILISWNLCSLPLIYISCPPGEWQYYLKIKSLLPKQSTGPGSNLESSHPLCAELASFPLYLFAFCMQTHTYFIFKRLMLCLSLSVHNDVLKRYDGPSETCSYQLLVPLLEVWSRIYRTLACQSFQIKISYMVTQKNKRNQR